MCIGRIIVVIICIECFCGSSHGIFQQTSSRVQRSLTPLEKPQLSICCPPGKFMASSEYVVCASKTSKPVYDPEIPQIFREDLKPSAIGPTDFQRIYRIPCDDRMYELSSEAPSFDVFYLLEDGRIFLNNSKDKAPDEFLGIDDYCFSSWMGENGTHTRILACLSTFEMQDFPFLYAISLAFPMPFLIVTFLVYACLPVLRNIHGMILMAYVASLFLAYGGITLMRLEVVDPRHSPMGCTFLAFFNYLWLMSSFFWLNVMCFDIWLTFRSSRTRQGSVKQCKKAECRKFTGYAIYAWGCPSILTIICLMMDFMPGFFDEYLSPSFGEFTCWFQDDISESIFLYCPMAITVMCNISLFISTTIKILRQKRETASQLERKDSRRHDDKQWFNLYLKLFIIMGVTWSMDIIGWLLGTESPWVRYVADGINGIEGVMIFIIFVCKNKIKRLLMKRFKCGEASAPRAV
ncbi:G-protein coupled receptor Mth2 isoform X2 [Diachasma alloeum]|uniref:G-protein coupled receptor Mth2 isoform X2 n=1 Tax=Diachasma alloeum TaxID=454923 RepID=UPI0007382B0A|nr:G-protein coupled receptor Mth2 isoform X2 [Diachasma alloeum]